MKVIGGGLYWGCHDDFNFYISRLSHHIRIHTYINLRLSSMGVDRDHATLIAEKRYVNLFRFINSHQYFHACSSVLFLLHHSNYDNYV